MTRVGVTGHQNIPPHALPAIRAEVAAVLAGVAGLTAVSSLAAGADQILAESAVEHGGELLVVIPCTDYRDTLTGPDRERFDRLTGLAAEWEVLAYPAPSEEAFMAAGRRVVDLSDRVVAIWDGRPAEGLGGTGDVVAYARSRALPVTVIWPDGLIR
jgi:hypothetical protein